MQTDPLNKAMIRSVSFVDRFAIGVSALCIAHCLIMPILLVALPVLGSSILGSEAVHLSLVYAVIPSSIFALSIGCTQHKRASFLLLGIFGLVFLVLGISVELIELDHEWETPFTVVGALLIVYAHVRNFQQCRKAKASASSDCKCD